MSNPYLSAYVAQNLRTCQLKQLSILEEVDRICRKHGIDYWLDGGTLLGAVRHGPAEVHQGSSRRAVRVFIPANPGKRPAEQRAYHQDTRPELALYRSRRYIRRQLRERAFPRYFSVYPLSERAPVLGEKTVQRHIHQLFHPACTALLQLALLCRIFLLWRQEHNIQEHLGHLMLILQERYLPVQRADKQWLRHYAPQ